MEENNNETTEQVTESTEAVVSSEEKKEETEIVKEEKKKKPVVAIILIIIALLALIVLAIFYFRPKKAADDKTDDTIVTQNKFKSEYRMSGNSIEKIDLAFLKLENEEKNKIYSPLSIKYALEMLSEGTNGDTKEQIDAVIGDYKANKYENNDNMSFANAMFIRNTFDNNVKQEYKDRLITKYNAEVILDSFESPNTINDWVSNKTFKLINNLVDNVDDKDFFLVNALAIDMKWNYQIHCDGASVDNVPCYGATGTTRFERMSTYSVLYNHEKLEGEDNEYEKISYPYAGEYSYASINFNGKENIKGAKVLADFNRYDAVKTIGEDKIREEVGKAYDEYVSQGGPVYEGETKESILDGYIESLNDNYGKAAQSTDFMLYDDDNVKAFAKDLKTYNGTTLQYVGIMPKTEKLTDYVNNLKVEDVNKVINNLKELKIENFKEGYVTVIEGDIPLFEYEYELQLMDDLKKLGITDVFEPKKADFSNMINNGEGTSIVEAKHKAKIEFSNEGIKAAAATEEGGYGNTRIGFNYLYEVPTIKINLTFDNPYLYLIRNKDTGEVWFIGTVYEPIPKKVTY